MKRILISVPILFLLSACSTGYHSADFFSGGFDEFKLSDDSYIVRFSGNRFTNNDRAYKYAMRRSAELTKEKGYKYFKIIQSSSTVDRHSYVTPLRANTQTNYNNYAGYGNSTTTVSGGEVITTEEPTTSITVKLYNHHINDAYDADTILSNFNKK